MPGLINMHTHSAMTLLRGYADDLRLEEWLQSHIWPAELAWADSQFVADGSELAILEMLKGGTTCFNENYFFPDQIAATVEQSGIRACIGIPLIDFKTKWAEGFDQYLKLGLKVMDRYHSSSRILFSLAPHSMYSVSDEMLQTVVSLAEANDMRIHMHMLETEWEIDYSIKKNKLRPLQHAEQLGLLNNRLLAVHMTHLSDNDIELLSEREVSVVHCPQSNLKLASGISRLKDLLTAGVNVSIGTDGAAANNDLDVLEELRTATLLAKGASNDPCAVDSITALDLVTINAARALGQENNLGSIEVGKFADLCALDLYHARTQPVHNVISQVVYAAAASQVSDVWVDGNRLLAAGQVISMDEEAVLQKAAGWAVRMQKKVKPARTG